MRTMRIGQRSALIAACAALALTTACTAGTAQLAANADSTALALMATDPALRAMASISGLGLYATHQYLRHHGIDPKSVKILQGSPPEMPGMLEQGSIDAYILYEPWAARGAAAGGHIAGRIGDFGVSYAQWLLADRSWLKDNERTAGKILKVVAAADELVTDDPAAAAKATNRQVKIPEADTKKVLPEISFAVHGIGDPDIAESKKIVDFYLDQKLIKKSPDLGTALLKGWYQRHAR